VVSNISNGVFILYHLLILTLTLVRAHPPAIFDIITVIHFAVNLPREGSSLDLLLNA
jgi:hypothetical protein